MCGALQMGARALSSVRNTRSLLASSRSVGGCGRLGEPPWRGVGPVRGKAWDLSAPRRGTPPRHGEGPGRVAAWDLPVPRPASGASGGWARCLYAGA